jgi:hypothetical protein
VTDENLNHLLLVAMKHDTAAMMMASATELTSSKIAENLISCRSHRVETQSRSPPNICTKIAIPLLTKFHHDSTTLEVSHTHTQIREIITKGTKKFKLK